MNLILMHHEWIVSLLGGAVIGASAVLLMAALGRIAGISGIAGALMAAVFNYAVSSMLTWRR